MTIDQKLDLFAERAIESANKKRKLEVRRLQETIKTATKEAEKEARLDAKHKLKFESSVLEKSANKEVYSAHTAARRKISMLKECLLTDLFADLERDLRDFAESREYQKFLFEGIVAITENASKNASKTASKTASEAADFSTILLMPRDMIYKEPIEAETPFTVEETDEDFIGGFKLKSTNGRAFIDHTLLARLKELDNDRGNLWNKWSGANG